MATTPSTHRALVVTSPHDPISVTTRPTARVTLGTVLLAPLLSLVPSYIADIFSPGNPRNYNYITPLVPGPSSIARILAAAPDIPSLHPGQLVWLDPLIRARDGSAKIMHGMGVRGDIPPETDALLHSEWRHGAFAEAVLAPAENVHVLDEEALLGTQNGLGYGLGDLGWLTALMVAYGGLRDVDLRAGETVLVAPATGGFGGAAVHVALALGARVVAMGRNENVLRELSDAAARAYPSGRLVTAKIRETVEETVGTVAEAAREVGAQDGMVDVFFDICPPNAGGSPHIKAGVLALRQRGRVSLMGGPLDDVGFPYYAVVKKGLRLQGTWMYTGEQVKEVLRLVETGVLKLGERAGAKCVGEYGLEEWEEAFRVAAREGRTGKYVMLRLNKE